jgi:hypothetical protein
MATCFDHTLWSSSGHYKNVKGNYSVFVEIIADNGFPLDLFILIDVFGLASHWKLYSVHLGN